MIFCIIRGFVNIDCDRLFSIVDCESSRTRCHNFKVLKEHSNIGPKLSPELLSVVILTFGIVCQPMLTVLLCSNVGFPERTFYVVNFLGF